MDFGRIVKMMENFCSDINFYQILSFPITLVEKHILFCEGPGPKMIEFDGI